jgi:mannose-6-phosphate isomerase-like protein (cupin superfamily)
VSLQEGYHCGAGEGEAVWFLDTLMTVKAGAAETHGTFTFIECLAPEGFGPPLHVHYGEDEAFYIVSGAMIVVCGEQSWTSTAGSFVVLPRDVPHQFIVTSTEPCRLLQVTAPGGFEHFIGEVGRRAETLSLPEPTVPDIAALAAVATRHGYEVLGPPLRLADPVVAP